MSTTSYLIDTNVVIGLEDNHTVKPAYAEFLRLSAKHKVDVFVHDAAIDDIQPDTDAERRAISLSKIEKFQRLEKVHGLTEQDLDRDFGPLRKRNDVVDATLLHAVHIGAVDFFVTEDQDLHKRAQRHSGELARRVMFVADAAQLLALTFEPREVPIRHVEEVSAHTISISDTFFDSLREGYPEFNAWWRDKCVRERRPCWVVYDDDALAGLIVRKDEGGSDTDATSRADKILKICTFKVSPEKRGIKLGELLLKQVLWFAQQNKYGAAYLTAYPDQDALISLLEFYGFEKTACNENGELIIERTFSNKSLRKSDGETVFDADRKNYPRFLFNNTTRAFVIPIKEDYHDILYPDLRDAMQPDIFRDTLPGNRPKRPGNTIRKVYLCRSPSRLGDPGSLLFFYKGKSKEDPSQAITALGILEDVSSATSTRELMKLTGGRSVFSERELDDYKSTDDSPLKVINFLLVGYIDQPIGLSELKSLCVLSGPPQSITELKNDSARKLIDRYNFGFMV